MDRAFQTTREASINVVCKEASMVSAPNAPQVFTSIVTSAKKTYWTDVWSSTDLIVKHVEKGSNFIMTSVLRQSLDVKNTTSQGHVPSVLQT